MYSLPKATSLSFRDDSLCIFTLDYDKSLWMCGLLCYLFTFCKVNKPPYCFAADNACKGCCNRVQDHIFQYLSVFCCQQMAWYVSIKLSLFSFRLALAWFCYCSVSRYHLPKFLDIMRSLESMNLTFKSYLNIFFHCCKYFFLFYWMGGKEKRTFLCLFFFQQFWFGVNCKLFNCPHRWLREVN